MSSNQGNFVLASGVSSQTLRVCSHWPKKLSTSAARARGSASMRRTCCSRTPAPAASPRSPGRAARRPGCCSTGRTTGARPARRRRDDRRRLARRPSGSASIRNRKSGLTSRRSSAARMPASKSAVGARAAGRSRAASGRRRSSPAGDTRVEPASTESSSRTPLSFAARLSGWHTKMRRRLGESCGTRPLYGPPISSDEMNERDARDVGVAVPDRNASRVPAPRPSPVGLDDGGDHLAQAGLQRHAHLQPSSRQQGFVGVLTARRRRRLGPPHRELPDARAVHANLDLVRLVAGRGSRPA